MLALALRASRWSFSRCAERLRVTESSDLLAAVERLLFGADLGGQRLDVAQFAFAQRGDLAQGGDLARHVREVARGEDIGQVVVVLVVAVGFAHHFAVLRAVAFELCRKVPGHAVRAGDLSAQEARLLFGLVEQLVARINLARQAAHPFLGGRAALLDLRNLLLFGGDPLFEGRDDPFLLLDAAVGLCGGGEGEEQERRGSGCGAVSWQGYSLGSGFLTAGCFSRCSICRAS